MKHNPEDICDYCDNCLAHMWIVQGGLQDDIPVCLKEDCIKQAYEDMLEIAHVISQEKP